MAEKPSSNTMEINSILEEAKRQNMKLSQESKSASRGSDSAKTVRRTKGSSVSSSRFDNTDYVDISSGAFNRPAADSANQKVKKKKKTKKPVVIAIVVVLVLALIGVGGFTWYSYEHSGSSTVVADKVSVNGVDIGGMTLDEAKKEITGIEEKLADGIKVNVTADKKVYNLTKDDFGYSFNTDEVLGQIREHSEEKGFNKEPKDFQIKIKVDTTNAKTIAENIAKENHSAPVNAKVKTFDSTADQMFTYEKEVVGKDIDPKDLEAKIKGVFKDNKTAGEVKAEVKKVNPKLTAKYLEENIVKLSEFSTDSTNNDNGNENMRVSLKACDSSIIDPDETWSFNECTGDSNDPDKGYMPAGVIVEGRSETGIGGGICQSSTTIYNAGLLCGMEIVERECHYYPSVYVEAGRDATIDYGNIDLKMKNTFDYQLFMKCWMDGTELHCEIYGLQNPEFDEIRISTSDADYFSNGFSVKAWRTYYKDGKEVREEDLPKSTYYNSAPSSGSGDDSSDDEDDESSSSDSSDNDSSDSSSASSESSDSASADDSASSAADAGDSGNANDGGASSAAPET